MRKEIIIIGGGAAGFFCAVNCAKLNPKAKVILLEKSTKLLAKVRVSGGGRCNVTHHCFDNKELVKKYPRGEKELHTAFSRFSVKETIAWFESRGVELKVEADGRMFPVSDSSETIINCLLEEAHKYNVEIRTNCEVKCITPDTLTKKLQLTLPNNEILVADKLLIATGGSPKESSYDWLRELGHSIEKPIPSLYTFNIPDRKLTALMGVSTVHSKIKITGHPLESEGPLLITHWGLSGPVVLKLSAWGAKLFNKLNYNFSIAVKWNSTINEAAVRFEFDEVRKLHPAKTILNTKCFDLPKRLWEYLLYRSDILNELRWADVPKKKLNKLISLLINDEYKVSGKTTFKEEFVTCGGVSLKEVDFKTMQSNIVPNLYFAGEVLNIDAITGGFNFQNAWTTGWLAAQDMSR